MTTDKIPDSVIVKDFYADQCTYKIWIDGAKASHSLSAPSSDPAQIMGFGSYLETYSGRTFIAYFAGHRASADRAPEYERELWLVANERVFNLRSHATHIVLRNRLSRRIFMLYESGEIQLHLEYNYSFFRWLSQSLFGDPFTAPRDILESVIEIFSNNAAIAAKRSDKN